MGKKGRDRKREERRYGPSDYANMTRVFETFRRPDRTGWEDAWIGIEPTFQSEKTVKLWKEMSVDEAGEDKYFKSDVMLGLEREVARGIRDKYEEKRKDGEPYCMFATVKIEEDKDQWGVKRHRHRVMPFLWAALDGPKAGLKPSDPVAKELELWKVEKEKYLERRPEFSPAGSKPPWEDA